MPLTQKQFAQLFAEAMDLLEIPGVRLAKAIRKHATTISRYRSERYASGPPEAAVRRLLEEEMGLPPGYLSGTVRADLMAIRRQRQTERSTNGTQGGPAALRAALRSIRGQVEGLLRQLERAELLAGGVHASDPAAEAALVEPERPAARGHQRRA
jgi:hypothetical protein